MHTSAFRITFSTMASASAKKKAIVWYKYNDLRIRDHEPLLRAHEDNDAVVHLFVFDPFWHGRSTLGGFPKCGHYRAKFLLESVADLRKSLRHAGSELVVRCGPSEVVLSSVAASTGASSVLTHAEVCHEELVIEGKVRTALAALPGKPSLRTLWGGQTLYHRDDLRMDVAKALPQVYSQFRRHVESKCTIRPPLEVPRVFRPSIPVPDGPSEVAQLSPFAAVRPLGANVGCGALPSLAALGVPDLAPHLTSLGLSVTSAPPPIPGANIAALTASAINSSGVGSSSSSTAAAGTVRDEEVLGSALPSLADRRGVLPFTGGETAALERMKHYFWTADRLRMYKETRNGLLGADYSSKFSPWLAAGCISPRIIASEVKAYEARVVANDSTYWLLFELLWRDYFRFAPLNWGRTLFWLWGPRQQPDASRVWRRDARCMSSWAVGRSGYPFVDANMRELLLSGFMSNRGRQNVASFFTKDLDMDWRLGAEWFESLLLDHDPGANYGNWTYVAGVGADPREDRYFLIPKQSRDYDRNGDYSRTWVPELASAPTDGLHDPRALSEGHRSGSGGSYPSPIVQLLAFRQGRGGGPPTHSGPGGASGRGGGNNSNSSSGGGGRHNFKATPGTGTGGGRANNGRISGGRGDGHNRDKRRDNVSAADFAGAVAADSTNSFPPLAPPSSAPSAAAADLLASHVGSRTSTGGGGKGKMRMGRVQHIGR